MLGSTHSANASPDAGASPTLVRVIERVPFGRTGHTSARTIFGAAALSRVTQERADAALAVILEHGIDHLDVAASYGDAELRLAPWLARLGRDRFFVATKTGKRSYAGAREEIRRSLERLGTDHVDLLQLHNLVEEDEWTTALGPGGALEAAVEARAQGLTRFIGVTGHGVTVAAVHLRSLKRFSFDSVLLPYNYTMMQNAAYRADFDELATVCAERGVAMQTIKSLTLAPWGEKPHTHTTWYEPLTAQADIDLAVDFVLGRPGIFLNTTGDVSLLPALLDAAARSRGVAPPDAAMREMAERREMAPLFV